MLVEGYLSNDWYFQRERVGRIEGDVIQLLRHTRYGIDDKLGIPRRVRVVNVLYELDQPGEWYFDHADGTLFAMICAKRPAYRKPLMPEGVGLYRSTDAAETWQKVSATETLLYPKDFTVHPDYSDIILIGACDSSWEDESGGLWRTTDGGRSFQRIGRRARQTFGGYFHPNHEGWIYMTLTEGAAGAGLWLSRDNGRQWNAFHDLPFSNIQRVVLDRADGRRMYVTTFGGSVWRGPITPNNR